MPEPTRSQLHVSQPLTDVSVAYKQKRTDYIFDQVFPSIPVRKQGDLYYVYDKKDWLRALAMPRARATESAGIGHTLSTDSYFCLPYAIHEDVSDQDRANADAVFDMDSDAAEICMQAQLNRAEVTWAANYFTTSKWGTDVAGAAATAYGSSQVQYWDNTASDPIADVEHYRSAMKQTTGFEPNTLVVGRGLYAILKNHPKIVARLVYNGQGMRMGSITKEAIAAILEVDRLLIASAIRDTANKNAADTTGTPGFIVASDSALLCYSAPRPARKVPSAGYTFVWSEYLGGSGIVTSKFRMEHLKADRIETEYAFDCKKVASDLGVFFNDLLT